MRLPRVSQRISENSPPRSKFLRIVWKLPLPAFARSETPSESEDARTKSVGRTPPERGIMNEKVDSVALTEVIDRCLDYSMDGRFTQDLRAEFLVVAKRLRGSLLNLLSARFDEGTQQLEEANAELTVVNTHLKKEAETLASAAQTIADLNKLIGSLDKLIGVAAGFL
jgi:hypothetical protein